MTDQTTAALARYGISIAFLVDGGAVELTGRNGVVCAYSSRGLSPVIGLGAPEGAIYVRRRPDGVAELRINGTVYEYRKDDPARRMGVPKDDLNDEKLISRKARAN
jgi:hypothetical protein